MIISLLAKFTTRYRQAHANHKRIASGALWVGIFVLAAKFCVALREIAIAWRYGISGSVDAFQLAVTITTWLPMLLAAIAGSVLVPRLVAIRRNGGDFGRLVGELNGSVLLLGIALALVSYLGAPLAVSLLADGLPAEVQSLTRSMIRQMAPIALMTVLVGYLSARLQARERFGYNFFEAVPALLIVLFAVGLPQRFGTAPLIWGTVIGFVVQTLVLGWMSRRDDPPLGGVRLRHGSDEWPMIYGPFFIMLLGQAIISATIPIDQAFASSLGEGAVATLGYAGRIIGLLMTLAFVVLGRALLPVLSEMVADGNLELGGHHTLRWTWLMIAIGATIAIVGWVAAPLVVRLFFERGAFSAADTAIVAEVLRYGLLQLPMFFGNIVLVQWLAATGRHKIMMIATVPAVTAKVVVNAMLVDRFGASGLMIGTAVMYTVNLVVLLTLNRTMKPVAPGRAGAG